MRKTAILAAALLTSTMFAAPTFAQSQDNEAPRKEVRETSEGPTVNQLTAMDDARIAKAKADLRLTSDQEGYWGKLERALKDISKRRADYAVARWKEDHEARDKDRDQRAEPVTPMGRMRRIADGMNMQAADLKNVADASEPLYNKLDDSQRRTIEGVLREQLSRPIAFEEGRRSRRSGAADW